MCQALCSKHLHVLIQWFALQAYEKILFLFPGCGNWGTKRLSKGCGGPWGSGSALSCSCYTTRPPCARPHLSAVFIRDAYMWFPLKFSPFYSQFDLLFWKQINWKPVSRISRMAFWLLVEKKKCLPIDLANERDLSREAACLGLEYHEVAPSSLLVCAPSCDSGEHVLWDSADGKMRAARLN